MKRWVPWILTAAMLFVAVCLVLSFRENDLYPGGSLASSEGVELQLNDKLLRDIVPERYVHACATCGECVHPVELVSNRRHLWITDRDGWYKLFWAADEIYSYDDPVHLAAALTQRTARDPGGSWRIRARLLPATHAAVGPHDCGVIPAEINYSYLLAASREPVNTTSTSMDGVSLPLTLPWFTYRYDHPALPTFLHFYWGTIPHQTTQEFKTCPCAKP